jgi:hypothetical protein
VKPPLIDAIPIYWQLKAKAILAAAEKDLGEIPPGMWFDLLADNTELGHYEIEELVNYLKGERA